MGYGEKSFNPLISFVCVAKYTQLFRPTVFYFVLVNLYKNKFWFKNDDIVAKLWPQFEPKE